MDWVSQYGNDMSGSIALVVMADFYPGANGLESKR